MCLLITGPSASVRAQLLGSPHLVDSIFDRNPDGIGVMYQSKKHGTAVRKVLPMTAHQAAQALQRMLPNDDRDVAVHFRWRTHGAINMEMCHPYHVGGSTWVMHNGILRQTSARATAEVSDTALFVQEYLQDLPPAALAAQSVQRMLGEFIGDNRLAFVSAEHGLAVVNREQGISHDGVWYSNEYAWEPALLIPGYRDPYQSSYGHGAWKTSWAGLTKVGDGYMAFTPKGGHEEPAEGYHEDRPYGAAEWLADSVEYALEELDVATLAELLDDGDLARDTVLTVLAGAVLTRHGDAEALADAHAEALAAWLDADADTLVRMCDAGLATQVAEAVLYFCDWRFSLEYSHEAG